MGEKLQSKGEIASSTYWRNRHPQISNPRPERGQTRAKRGQRKAERIRPVKKKTSGDAKGEPIKGNVPHGKGEWREKGGESPVISGVKNSSKKKAIFSKELLHQED